jgi:hypothetical protein
MNFNIRALLFMCYNNGCWNLLYLRNYKMSFNFMPRYFLFALCVFCAVSMFSNVTARYASAQDKTQDTTEFEIENETVNNPLPQEMIEKNTQEQAQKFAIANEILALNPLDRTLTTTIDDLAQQVPANRRILFKSIMNRSIKIDRLNTAAQLAFAEIFTLKELRAMRDFYASEEGASINQKMPDFESRIQPVIEAMVQDAVYNIRNSNVDFSQ